MSNRKRPIQAMLTKLKQIQADSGDENSVVEIQIFHDGSFIVIENSENHENKMSVIKTGDGVDDIDEFIYESDA